MGCSASVETQDSGKNSLSSRNGAPKTDMTDKITAIDCDHTNSEQTYDDKLIQNGKVGGNTVAMTKHFDSTRYENSPPLNEPQKDEYKVPLPLTKEQLAVEKALKDLRQSLFGDTGASVNNVSTKESTIISMRGMSPGLDIDTATSDDPFFKVAVIDAGTGFCKAGLTGDDIPSVVIPTIVGRQREWDSGECFIGKDAKLRGDLLQYSHPIKRGVVVNWDDMEKVYEHLLHMDLNLEPREYGVALPEPPHSTRERREKITQMMFEKFNVRKLYLGSSSALAMHALGMSSGLVVSIGHGVCHSVPVLQGNAINDARRSTNIGNEDLIRHMKTLVNTKSKLNIDDDIARALVEKTCFVRDNGSSQKSPPKINYTLPSGYGLQLQHERFTCAEIFFNPKDSNEKSITEICRESLEAVSGEKTASELRRNIILTGGPSLLPGLSERLKLELSKRQAPHDETNIVVLPKRQYAAWRGASILASLNSSKHRWITKSQFDEHGVSIIHRKFL